MDDYSIYQEIIKLANSIDQWWESIGKFICTNGEVYIEPEFVISAKKIISEYNIKFDHDELVKKLKNLGYEERKDDGEGEGSNTSIDKG